MNVCHVTSAHGRYDTRIFQKECSTLADEKFNVFLIVNDNQDNELVNDVKIVSTGFVAKSRLDRIRNGKKYSLSKILEIKPDVVHLHDPELLMIVKKIRKKLPKCQIIFDSHEDVGAQIRGKEWIPAFMRSMIAGIYNSLEKSRFKKLSAIITVTPHLYERVKALNPNTLMVANFPLIDSIKLTDDSKKSASLVFAGGIEAQWNHHVLLNAIKDVEVEYRLCGKADTEYLSKLMQHPSWNKVNYYGQVSFDKVQEIIGESMIGMVLLQYSANTNWENGTLGNTKIFECMANGIPVICTDFTIWKEIIDKYSCGIYVKPNEEESIRKAVNCLLEQPDLAKKMGENGRKAIQEEYNWGFDSKKLVDLYKRLERNIL